MLLKNYRMLQSFLFLLAGCKDRHKNWTRNTILKYFVHCKVIYIKINGK